MVDDSDKPELSDPLHGLSTQPKPAPNRNKPFSLDELRIGRFLPAEIERFKRRARGDELPIHTPWPSLDSAIGRGFWPGQSIVLCASPGVGKTQMAMAIAVKAASDEHPVVMVQLESNRGEVAARLIGAHAELAWSDLYLGRDEAEGNIEAACKAAAHFDTLPLYIHTASPLVYDPESETDGIVALVRGVAARHPGKEPLVILDYIQIAASPSMRGEIRERIGYACRVAKQAALEFDGVLLLISAVSRDGSKQLKDLKATDLRDPEKAASLIGIGRETSEIEFSADTMLALRPGQGKSMHVAVVKSRGCGAAWVKLNWNGYGYSEAPGVQDGLG